MRLPDAQHWLFSIKTFSAGMMALSIAFWLDLPRPYWALATVYVASQPLSGATRSKALFRAVGTPLGAAAAVLMVPNLVNTPLLLVLAISLWSGLCLYLSLLDRSPRGYAFMLAGYTTAIVGFPAVDAPATIFDIALARTEEILVGIACAALVSSLVFPRTVGPIVAERVQAWLRHAEVSSRDALDLEKGAVGDSHWLRLAADTTEIENLAAHLAFDTTIDRQVISWVQRLLPRMLMMLTVLSSISDRLGELHLLGGPSPRAAALIARVGDGFDVAGLDASGGLRTPPRDEHYVAAPLINPSWQDLIEATLFLRLRELINIHADCSVLTAALADDSKALTAALVFPVEARIESARYADHGAALFAAFTLFVSIALVCAFWIASGWPDGATAALMTAIAGSLFAAQDDPTPSIADFTKWTAVGVAIAGLYLFGVLPQVHTLETLTLALAPAFLVFGLLMAAPETFMIGLPLGLLTPSSMALQQLYSVDADAFMNSSLATIIGMGLAAATTALIRTTSAQWRAARYALANRAAFAQAADIKSRNDEARVMGLMFDRLSLLAPSAHAVGHTMPDALRELRAGFNILDAHRARFELAPSSRRMIDAVLMRLARHYRQGAASPTEDLLASIQRALRLLGQRGDRSALLALVGLRRSLFPNAPPPSLSLLTDSMA